MAMGKDHVSRAARLESLNLVNLAHTDPSGRVDLETVGRTLDLSLGGILLEVPRPVPATHETVEITIGFRDQVISCRGRIVHQRELASGNVGLGISFTALSERDRGTLAAFLSGA